MNHIMILIPVTVIINNNNIIIIIIVTVAGFTCTSLDKPQHAGYVTVETEEVLYNNNIIIIIIIIIRKIHNTSSGYAKKIHVKV